MAQAQDTVYRPKQENLYFPQYPKFESVEAERWHRRQRLAAVCRVFAKYGYEYGFAGHVTVRDPEHPELFWTNPFAMDFGRVRASDMLLVDHAGTVLEGRWAVNRAGFVLHSAIHQANPDIVASCHAHTTHGMAWAALGRPLDPITQTACGFYEDQAVITEEAGAVVVENDKGHAVARAFGNAKIAIHQNHGLFSVGRETVEEAAWWFIAAERACEIQLKAEATGRPLKLVSREAALHSKKHLATPFMAWLQLRRLPDGASITSLPFYAARNWWQGGKVHPVVGEGQPAADGDHVLNVHVWTAVGSAEDPERRLLIDRYVAAVDRKGVISTGHAALEMPPDLYISHYPADDIDHSPEDFRPLLLATRENDVPGRFNESLQAEAAAWCMPDQKVTFRRFNPRALRTFWDAYSRDNTYNLTARNCSTTVIQALDAAMEGACDTGRPWRDCLRIVSDPNFWLMRIVRGRAEAMTWTPGLVLDYARLLHQVVEYGERRWRRRISEALRARRRLVYRRERAQSKRAAA